MDLETVTQNNKMQVETLETEVRKFVRGLPYWSKYLANICLLGNAVTDDDIDASYFYLLEQLNLEENTEKADIVINNNAENSGNYKHDLLLSKLERVEGVNALTENQTIEFNPKLTIIYGENGSGKSGYVRLFKDVFYSRSPEKILQNIHIKNGHKPINAKFIFNSNNTDIAQEYSHKNEAEFDQFSVFDGKSVISHLEQKNEFEFRPAGLGFFADYAKAVKKIENKLNTEILNKKTNNDFSILFEGKSEIKTLIDNLSSFTKTDDLHKHVPFSDSDRLEKERIEKQYDELLLNSKGKSKEIKNLERVKRILGDNQKAVENINRFFTEESLSKVYISISDCLNKEATAKMEGSESFKTDLIEGVGTKSWKDFIVSAEKFAKEQNKEESSYPKVDDSCLLCHQPLSEASTKLIDNYWIFIKSVAEENSKKSNKKLQEIEKAFDEINFNLFPEENTLTVWLSEKYPNELNYLTTKLSDIEKLSINIISDIQNRVVNSREEVKISIKWHEAINDKIDSSINTFKDDKESKELEGLLTNITYFKHKEKFNTHFSKFETFVNNQIWIKKAEKASYAKRKITDTEKMLSDKYFNQKYIDIFNQECKKLNGNFGIKINHTGSAGRSYRQLKLKGINPNSILSDGEQKVIAIADFITEMKLSEINRGIIFDDPVTSLDEIRKSEIAHRLVEESAVKQVVIFTHDLVFVSSLIAHCRDLKTSNHCHWIENAGGNQPGIVWLNNTPSFEKDYKTSGKAQDYYNEAKKSPPELREDKIKNGFAALRTSYEAQVVFGLFKGVVQRFEERVSVDSLKDVVFSIEIRDDILDSFYRCCRYMEGHSHSDKYAYKKPSLESLNEEIQRFNQIKKKIKEASKSV